MTFKIFIVENVTDIPPFFSPVDPLNPVPAPLRPSLHYLDDFLILTLVFQRQLERLNF